MIKKAFWGVKWLVIQQLFVQFINLGSLIYLSNLIKPEIHGFFSIAIIGVTLTSVLGSIGLNEIIIKDQTRNFEKKLNFYFGIIILLSAMFFFISSFFGFIVSLSYKAEFGFQQLLKYSILLSLVAFITPYRSYIEAVRSKDLDFKKLSLIQISTLFIGVVPSIFLAYFGYDYLSLSSRFFLPHIFYVLFGFIYFKIPTTFKFSLAHLKELKNFSLYYSLNNIVNYFVRNIDYLIIGKLFSPEILGQYVIAYKILLFPLKNVTSKIVQVGMPLLSKVVDNTSNFKKKYFLMLESVSFVTIPIMIFVSFYSESLTNFLFNQNYPLLGDMIKYLAIVGAIQSVISPVGMLYYFKENTKLMFYVSIGNFILLAFSFYFSSIMNDIFLVLKVYGLVYIFIMLPNSVLWIYKLYKFSLVNLFNSTIYYLVMAVISISLEYVITMNFQFENLFLKIFVSFIISSIIYVTLLFTTKKVLNKPVFFKLLLKNLF